MKNRPPIVRAYLGDELLVDSFAGGGGASTGIELALGRSPDLAVNHDAEAIAMHRANHPETEHRIESVWAVDPRAACRGKPVALAWFSPDCKHHSKAKGGKPREQKIRGLAWVAVTWAQRVRPRVIALENVEEFREWGPLHRSGSQAGKPIAARRGETFRAFVCKLERLGYVVEHRLLRACDYGAPTTRRRLFLIARCDGRPIAWPKPTHGPALTGRPHRHRTAAEIIDWSIPCPSIFDRERPLADKTLARIARGIRKFVIESASPFVIPVNHGGVGRTDHRVHDLGEPMPTITGGQRGGHALVTPIVVKAKTHGGGGNDAMHADEPLRTITGSKRGEFAIAVPYLVHRSNGERPEVTKPDGTVVPGQAPRIYDPQQPLRTVVAQGEKYALCAAFLAKHYGGHESTRGGTALDAAIDTVTAQDHHSLVAAHLTKFYGTSTGSDPREPTPTITGDGQHIGTVAAHLVRYNGDRPGAERVAEIDAPLGTQDTSNRYGLVASFLARYNRTGDTRPLDTPIGVVDTHDRYALITVTIDGEPYVIVDIGMRMLTPRELFRAQGFAEDYQIDPPGPAGKPLTKTAQIRMCGNSVCPPIAAAIVRAQFPEAA